jgi:hypothetical protein
MPSSLFVRLFSRNPAYVFHKTLLQRRSPARIAPDRAAPAPYPTVKRKETAGSIYSLYSLALSYHAYKAEALPQRLLLETGDMLRPADYPSLASIDSSMLIAKPERSIKANTPNNLQKCLWLEKATSRELMSHGSRLNFR